MNRKYTLICEPIIRDGEERITYKSENVGFSAIEILGMLDWKREDVLRQMRGEVKPDIITRTLVIDEQDGGAE